MLPSGKRTPKGTADVEHVAAGFTFMSGNSFQLKTGTLVDPDTSDATAVAANILAPKTAYANAVKVTGTMVDRSNTSVPPNGSPLAAVGSLTLWPAQGYYDGTSAKLVITDADIDPANVKAGIDFIGTAGTFTADGTADAVEILIGETAYVNGVKITGTMPDNGDLGRIVPGTTDKPIAVGFTDGGSVAGDANLVADKIPVGVSMFGITGTYSSDSDAIAADLRQGKTAYVNGVKITGTAVF